MKPTVTLTEKEAISRDENHQLAQFIRHGSKLVVF